MQKTVLSVNAISKDFQHLKAVNNISFTVGQGDIYAFLGPNGAGKTTTLRMLLDIIKPDSGQIAWSLNGKQNQLPAAGQIGYLPEERGLYLDIPILKSLVYLAGIRGMEKAAAKKLLWSGSKGLALPTGQKKNCKCFPKVINRRFSLWPPYCINLHLPFWTSLLRA